MTDLTDDELLAQNGLEHDQVFGMHARLVAAAKAAEAGGDMQSAQELRAAAQADLANSYRYMDHLRGQDDPTSGMSGGQKFAAGMGQGATDVGRHVQNLVGARSDEQMQQDAQMDAPLLKSGAGAAGALTGA